MSDNSRRAPFNAIPIRTAPTAPQVVVVGGDIAQLLANLARPAASPAPEPYLQRVDNGFRRFVQCAECKKATKLYVCYKDSAEACGRDNKSTTHTHIRCECNGGRDIVLSGNVQFRTRLDRPTMVTETATEAATS